MQIFLFIFQQIMNYLILRAAYIVKIKQNWPIEKSFFFPCHFVITVSILMFNKKAQHNKSIRETSFLSFLERVAATIHHSQEFLYCNNPHTIRNANKKQQASDRPQHMTSTSSSFFQSKEEFERINGRLAGTRRC